MPVTLIKSNPEFKKERTTDRIESLEIAELFDISKGTVYDYITKHTKELQHQKSIFFDLKIEL